MYIAENQDAKFWLSVLTELKNRRLQDILIGRSERLPGCISTDAYPAVYHSYSAQQPEISVTSGLKMVYQAPTQAAALMVLDNVADAWDDK